MGRGRWKGEKGLKSHIENVGEDMIWRERPRGEGGLKSQLDNTEHEEMGRERQRADGGRNRRLKIHWRMGLGESGGGESVD